MAKLTATFELHDKISRKLRMIQGNAERLKRAANGPLILRLKTGLKELCGKLIDQPTV